MSIEAFLAGAGLLVALVGVAIGVWALLDVRAQVKRLISLERKLIYTRVRNDLVWQFVEPIGSIHSPEIAKGLEEFAVISQALNPEHTADLTKHAVENEALAFSKTLMHSASTHFKPSSSQ